MMPATPTCATRADAPEDVVVAGAVLEPEDDAGFVVDVLPVPAGVVAVVDPPAAVVEPVVALVGAAAPPDSDVVLVQLVELPCRMGNGADDAVAPVLSRSVRPMEVPAGRFTSHVTDVEFCWPRSSRACALG